MFIRCAVTFATFIAVAPGVVGCTITPPTFGARCSNDVGCAAGLVCVVDVCVPGAAADVDAGPDPVDGGPDPVDGGPDPVDGGPEPIVFNRAPRAFGTTVVVAADGTAVVTLRGSDPDGDPLTFSVTTDATTAGVTLDGAVATVTALATDGAFTFTVDDGALSDTATVNVAVSTLPDDAATTVYIGENGGSWNDGANWSVGVPGQFVVRTLVPADKVVVVQSGPFNLQRIEIENGAVVELGGFFINTTEALLGGEVRCTASPCLRAATVAGRLPSWQATGGARLAGATIVEGRLLTESDFLIDVHSLTTLGPVEAQGGFNQSGAVFHNEGSFLLQRNVTLAGGTWSLRGNLVRTDGSFASTGTHRMLLDGAGSQSVSLGGGGCVNDIDVQTPELVLAASAAACGRVTVRAGAHVGGTTVFDVAGPFALEEGGRFDVDDFRPRGTVTLAGDGFNVRVVRLTGNLNVPDIPYRDLEIAGNGTLTLQGDITVAGALRSPLNDFAELDVGEFTLTLQTLALTSPSRLGMAFPDARVVIAGDATLAPNNGSTMRNGVIEVGGNLRFDNVNNPRYSDGEHAWRITGTTTMTSANGTALLARLEIAEGASLLMGDDTPLVVEPNRALTINGALTIPTNTTLRLLPGTTVTCGPLGTVVLNGICTQSDAPCEALCP